MYSSYRLSFVVFFLLVQLSGVHAQAIDLSVYALGYADDHKTVYLLNGEDETVEIALSLPEW